VAVRSTAYVCGGLMPGIVGLNPAKGMHLCILGFAMCCVGSGLCDVLSPPSEKSYGVCVPNDVWCTDLNNEAAWAWDRLLHQRKENVCFYVD
jgi:hypothetical protein